MSKELVVLNQNENAELTQAQILDQVKEDNGNWGDEDEVSLPGFISMKQALTEGQDHLANGTFFNKASGQSWDKIDMVILSMHKTRQWKPSSPKFVQDEKALCRSNDGKTAVTDDDRLIVQTPKSLNPVTGEVEYLCKNCPKQSWAGYDKVQKSGQKPVCDKGFFFLFLDAETNLPYIYNASGQGVDPSEQVYEAIRARAKVVKAKTGRMPNTYDFVVSMGSEKGNKAFKPKFTTVKQLNKEDAAKFGPLYLQFVTSRKNANVIEEPSEGQTTVYEADDTGAVIEGESETVAI
jgi:hypothetical protein